MIGNPPYIESRNSNFPEKLKDCLQSKIKFKYSQESVRECFPRGADLLIFFYEQALSLLSQNGINTFITENAWLSTDYGKAFQNYLLKNIHIQGIIDSDYKYFETADINTVITIFRKKTGENHNVQFFHCHENFAVHPCRTLDIEKNDKTIEIKSFKQKNILLQKYKWGFLFSADEKLLKLLELMNEKCNLSVQQKIEIGQGLNITKDNIQSEQTKNSVPYFISDVGAIFRWTDTKYFVDKKVVSKTRRTPMLILPRGLGTHFCSTNEVTGYSSSYVEIYEKEKLSEKEKLQLWIFCNSSLLWLLREYTGRCNLGGGMLKAEATDLKTLPLCFDFENIQEMKEIFEIAKGQYNSSKIEEAINSEVHKRIDKIVFDYFNLSSEDNFITDMLIKRYNWRNKKSKTK